LEEKRVKENEDAMDEKYAGFEKTRHENKISVWKSKKKITWENCS
jgi:hypothetical protein